MTPAETTLFLYFPLLWLEGKALIPILKFLINRNDQTPRLSSERLKVAFSEAIWTGLFSCLALTTLGLIWVLAGTLVLYPILAIYGSLSLLELVFFIKTGAALGTSRNETNLKRFAIYSKSLQILISVLLIVLNY